MIFNVSTKYFKLPTKVVWCITRDYYYRRKGRLKHLSYENEIYNYRALNSKIKKVFFYCCEIK